MLIQVHNLIESQRRRSRSCFTLIKVSLAMLVLLSLGIVVLAQFITYDNFPKASVEADEHPQPIKFLTVPFDEERVNQTLDVLTLSQINSSNLETNGFGQYLLDDDEFVHVTDGLVIPKGDYEHFEEHRRDVKNPFVIYGAYRPIDKKYFNSYPGSLTYYHKTIYSIQKNDGYCDIVDKHNLANPDNIFGGMKFITDYPQESFLEFEGLPRSLVMREIGLDVNPTITRLIPKEIGKIPKFQLNTTANFIFTKVVDFHLYHEIGKHFLCATQMYNHIPGNGVLKRKDLVVDSFKEYQKRFVNKSQCLKEIEFFPQAYRLYIKKECQDFFKLINSFDYKQNKANEPIQFLEKLGFGAHRAKGVAIFDENKEIALKRNYENGFQCGWKTGSLVMQKYIANPLVLDRNNKFDFRIYMLVASTNPMLAYYHDGFLRVSLKTYNKTDKNKDVHLTNTHLSKKTFKDAGEKGEWEGMTEEQLREYQMWTLEKLTDFLLKSGKISDPNWLENYLRPAFKKAFVHLIRMSEDLFLKHSGVFELYGLDFMLDDNLKLWFIECNASPQYIGTNKFKTEILTKMLKDMFEIEYGLLRSRMKRVMDFIKTYQDASLRKESDLHKLKEKFEILNRNNFEPEYLPSANNGWQKILDRMTIQNITEQYMGLINEDCIDY